MDPNIVVEERLFILSKVFQAIPMYFAHWEDALIQPEELDDVFKRFVPRVLAAESRVAFSRILYEFFGLLNNGHTAFRDTLLLKDKPGLGFSMTWIAGRWIVTSSHIDSLQAGDAIIGLNRTPIEDWYREIEKYLRCGSERNTRTAFGTGEWIGFDFPLQYDLEWENAAGDHQVASVDRQGFPPLVAPDSPGATEGRWVVPNEVAYLWIPSFGDPQYEEAALRYVSEYQDARVLIVDVRDNPGGNTPLQLRNALVDRPFRFGGYSSPQHIGV